MSIKVVLTRPLRNRKIFVTGFHGIGLVGYIAVRHLITALNCERVGFVEMKQEPAYSGYSSDRSRLITPGELYHSDSVGITLFLANWGFSERVMYSLIRCLAGWVYENCFSFAVLFGGLDSEARGSDTAALRIVVTQRFKELGLSTCGAKEMDVHFSVIGPLALLLNEFERIGFPAVAILPYASKWRSDPAAAVVGLEFFSNCFGVSVEVDKLRELAERYEKELQELRRAIEEEQRRREGAPYYI